ncbi:MAG: hypothetical protein ONA90_10085 [candidate division KSB1 bacterium]|nr:hypothetical protein [candidate division KSB1 bacterium]
MCISKKLTRAALLFFAGQLWACASSAQTSSKNDLADLSKASDVVVVAKCITKASQWNYNKSVIYTKYSFEVEKVIKGEQKTKTFDLRHLGGQVGEAAMDVSHMPDFQPGHSYVLFLSAPKNTGALISKEEKDTGQWQPPRLMARANQGKFDLTTDPETGKVYVINPPAEAMPKTSKGYAQSLEELDKEKRAKTAPAGKLYLDDFVRYLETQVR